MLTHFIIKEFVPPEIWSAEGEQSISLVDPRLLITIEAIRVHFNRPITINDWHLGGQYKYRGYRPKDCKVGAKLSMHKEGKALDFDVCDLDAREVREEILKNEDKFPHIKRMENNVDWIHIDLRGTGQNRIVLFNA
jgi:hypothetical protein